MPPSIVLAYWGRVKGVIDSLADGGWVFPCNATLANYTFGVGTFRGVIPGSYMNMGPIATDSEAFYGGLQIKQWLRNFCIR